MLIADIGEWGGLSMRKPKDKTKSMKNSVGRAAFVAFSILLQIGWLMYIITLAGESFQY